MTHHTDSDTPHAPGSLAAHARRPALNGALTWGVRSALILLSMTMLVLGVLPPGSGAAHTDRPMDVVGLSRLVDAAERGPSPADPAELYRLELRTDRDGGVELAQVSGASGGRVILTPTPSNASAGTSRSGSPASTSAAAGCAPNVAVATSILEYVGNEPRELLVTVSGTGLQRITWTGVTNAQVIIGGSSIPIPAYADFNPVVDSWSFRVRKVTLGQSFTAMFVPRDACGDISKFVGAGTYAPPTPVVTPTFTPTLTLTPTLVPTSTATLAATSTPCSVVAQMSTSVTEWSGQEPVEILVTVLPASTPGNLLRRITWTSATNASVRVNGSAITVPAFADFNPPAASWAFTVRKQSLGQPFTVNFLLRDDCGETPKFVGAGTAAPPTATSTPTLTPAATHTPTPTVTSTPTLEPTMTMTATVTMTMAPTSTPTMTPTLGPSPTQAPTGTSSTPVPTPTATPDPCAPITTITPSSTAVAPYTAPASERLFVASFTGNKVFVFDPNFLGSALAAIDVGSGPKGIAVRPGGSEVYVANNGAGTVSVIRTFDLQVVATIPVGSSPQDVVFSPDGSRAFVSNFSSSSVSVIATGSSPSVIQTITVGAGASGMAVRPGGQQLYVTNLNEFNGFTNGTVSVVQLASEPYTVVATYDGMDGIEEAESVVFNSSGDRAYVNNRLDSGNGKVVVLNPATTSQVTSICVSNTPRRMAFHASADRLYVTSESTAAIDVINTSSNSVVGTVPLTGLPAGIAQPFGIVLSPDGRRLYIATQSSTKKVVVLDTATLAQVALIDAGDNPQGLAYKP